MKKSIKDIINLIDELNLFFELRDSNGVLLHSRYNNQSVDVVIFHDNNKIIQISSETNDGNAFLELINGSDY